MWLFPKRIIQFITGGGGDGLGLSTGVDTQDDNFNLQMAQEMGVSTQRMDHDFAPTLKTGTDTQADIFGVDETIGMGIDSQRSDLSLEQTRDMGSESASMLMQLVEPTLPMGVDSQSMAITPSLFPTMPQGTDTENMGGQAPMTTALDAGGNGRHGTAVGLPLSAAPFISGFGRAASLGNSDYFTCGFAGLAVGGLGQWCFEWRMAGTSSRNIIASGMYGSAIANRFFYLGKTTGIQGNVAVAILRHSSSTTVLSGATSIADGNPHALRLNYDGANYRLYVDGTLAAGPTAAGAVQTHDSLTPLLLGRITDTANSYAGHAADEVRLSNVHRGIGASYTVDTTPFIADANTLGLWHLDDQVGNELSLEMTAPQGQESASQVVDVSADLSQHTSGATATLNSGTGNWTNPSNANGAINGTEATHAGLTGLNVACDATLRCPLPAIGATPSGFTMGAVTIRIVHRWDLTITAAVAGVTDASNIIELRDNANALIATLNTRTAAGGGGTQATLLTEDYDITALVTGAQLAAGIKVDCHAICGYVPATNGNTAWQVDAVHLKTSYSRTGLT